jgi:hypothetical protein
MDKLGVHSATTIQGHSFLLSVLQMERKKEGKIGYIKMNAVDIDQ